MEMHKVLMPTLTETVIKIQEVYVPQDQYLTLTEEWKNWCVDMHLCGIKLPMGHALEFFKITFHHRKILPIKWSGYLIPKFHEPIEVSPGYRIIPGYSDYVVSENGDIKRILYDSRNKIYLGNSLEWVVYNESYPFVSLSSKGVNGKVVQQRVHRLVAYAWVVNTDIEKYDVVNHLNGNKLDPRAVNLEWTDTKGNNKHAVKEGLRTDNLKCRIKALDTGEVIEFSSVREAVLHMGLDPDTRIKQLVSKRKHRLIADKYEFRMEGDETPWYYQTGDDPKKGSRYIITVKYPDGNEEITYGVVDFIRRYKLWNMFANVRILTAALKERMPDCEITWTDHYNGINEIEAYHLESGKVFEAKSMRDMSRMLDVHYGYIHHRCNSQHLLPINGYLFRFKTDRPWDLSKVADPVNKSKSILIHDKVTGKEFTVDSLRAASKLLGMDRSVIKRCLLSKEPIGNFIVSYT